MKKLGGEIKSWKPRKCQQKKRYLNFYYSDKEQNRHFLYLLFKSWIFDDFTLFMHEKSWPLKIWKIYCLLVHGTQRTFPQIISIKEIQTFETYQKKVEIQNVSGKFDDASTEIKKFSNLKSSVSPVSFVRSSSQMHIGPENLKLSRQKNSWNQINQKLFSWNCISGSFKLFPSSKIEFWPFLKLQKMEFG